MHQDVTANQLWSHLESKGLHRRHLAGDPSSIVSLRKTVERHARHVADNQPRIGLVPSSYASQLRETLANPGGRQLVVLDGIAGYGKSTIVAEVVPDLMAAGWLVAAANMSVVDPSAVTSTKLGNQIGLGDTSPGVVLAGVSDGQPGLLVVDQLDAVSTQHQGAPGRTHD
jgi:predicted ATP-dependent serine protease